MSTEAALSKAEQHLEHQEWREMHAICLDVLKTAPKTARAWYLLGILSFEHQNYYKALELFEKAKLAERTNATYTAHIAKTLISLGRQEEALERIEEAISEEPADALTLDTIGVIFSRAGFHDRAIDFFEKAIALVPDNASYQYNLASSLQFSGRFTEAEIAYTAAISLNPDDYRSYSAIVRLAKQTAEKNWLPELETLFEKFQDDAEARLHLGHAAAKTYEDIGAYEESLHWLFKAKKIKKADSLYDHQLMRQITSAAKATSLQKGHGGHDTEEPIFIIGMPRSGTTLVDRILSSHSTVQSAGELAQLGKAVKAASTSQSNLMLDPETLSSSATTDMTRLGETYLESTRPLTGQYKHFTDKMPLNFFYAGIISRALPKAKIICLRRNGMDTCLSNFRQLFRSGNTYYSYSYDLENTGRYFLLFDELVRHWAETISPNQFMEIQYEEIVADQEEQTRRLLKFCDLPWEDACLDFHQNKAPVATASSVQVRQPLYASSVDRWKKYGSGLDPLKRILTRED